MTRVGAALPTVLVALGISSALTIGGAFVARRAAASARSRISLERLGDAAEVSIGSVLSSWDTTAMSSLVVGQTVADSTKSSDQQTSTWVTRLTHNSFWIVSESCRRPAPRVCRRNAVALYSISDSNTITYGQPWAELP
jgi:hypothetical protein